MLPAAVRQRAREAREAAQRFVKQSRELADRADVLMRELEAALKRSAKPPFCNHLGAATSRE
jgi:hypothetical protein